MSLCRAVTEVGSDHESPEPAKNVVELLAPFLAAQPPDVSSQPAMHVDAAANTAAYSAAEALQAEPAEVQKFIDQQHANSGMYAVASGLLERLLSTGSVTLSSEVMEGVMILEAAVQGEISMQNTGQKFQLLRYTAAQQGTAGHAQQPLLQTMQKALHSQASCMRTTGGHNNGFAENVPLYGVLVLQAGSALRW